jgi:5,10-methylenetetrahydromethanopterin reductase
MTNAAATATLAGLAPGRVAVSFGTGFTGRRAMGYRAIPWSYMTSYIDAYCGLLRGEVVEWEGARMQMLHPDGSAPARPIEVPILIGALGPKGRAVAARHDGLFATTTLEGLDPGAFDWVAYLYWGTVLEPGEDVSSDRVLAAAGPGGALAHHATYELYGRDAVPTIPGGKEWLEVIDARPDDERHLGVHVGHCIHLNEADRAAWAVTGGALLPTTTVTGTADEVKARIDDLGGKGVTEVVFQPCGPDTRRELEAMFAVASG